MSLTENGTQGRDSNPQLQVMTPGIFHLSAMTDSRLVFFHYERPRDARVWIVTEPAIVKLPAYLKLVRDEGIEPPALRLMPAALTPMVTAPYSLLLPRTIPHTESFAH